MKTLSLLRHAKAEWGGPTTADFDRALNARGVHAAHALGRRLRELGVAFDATLASPARRAVGTVEGLAEGYGHPLHPVYEPRLYLAPQPLLLELVRATDDAIDRLLIVGHNPGFALLANALAGHGDPRLRARLADSYPSGAFAEIALPVARWADAAGEAGELARFIRPRDLEMAGRLDAG